MSTCCVRLREWDVVEWILVWALATVASVPPLAAQGVRGKVAEFGRYRDPNPERRNCSVVLIWGTEVGKGD